LLKVQEERTYDRHFVQLLLDPAGVVESTAKGWDVKWKRWKRGQVEKRTGKGDGVINFF
jgi:hypothetical protein